MRSSTRLTLFVSCSYLVAFGCSSASSNSGDSSGDAGTSATTAGALNGNAGAGISGSSSSAGSAGAAGAGDTLTGGGGTSGASTAGGAGAGGSGGLGMPTSFVHPGILVDKGMLDFVKGKIAAGTDPWKSALAHASGDGEGSLDYTAHPRATVECGPSSNPDIGCTDEKNDVIAAYTDALIWYYTGNQKYADKSIQIMNAWSAVLKEHTNDNAQLQAAWCAEMFPRAAEIIRYSNAGWSAADIQQFSTC
jgi:hypothetical protein